MIDSHALVVGVKTFGIAIAAVGIAIFTPEHELLPVGTFVCCWTAIIVAASLFYGIGVACNVYYKAKFEQWIETKIDRAIMPIIDVICSLTLVAIGYTMFIRFFA